MTMVLFTPHHRRRREMRTVSYRASDRRAHPRGLELSCGIITSRELLTIPVAANATFDWEPWTEDDSVGSKWKCPDPLFLGVDMLISSTPLFHRKSAQ